MTDDVLISVEGATGRLRLNRPKAIHALNHPMCLAMTDALLAWADDPAIGVVLIDHAEGRGFCAGGDVVVMSQSCAGDGVAAKAFWFDEYRLNHLLFTYAKPTVAFIDGIVMGGGVGIADPCTYRVATERTIYAMPETGIGLFPDVGGGWYLSRLPGRIGRWLALTGARLNGADCLKLGLATHYIASVKLDEAKQWLIERPASEIGTILDGMSDVPDNETISAHRDDIDRLFASDRFEDILAALAADGGEWAAKQLAILHTKSPTSCKIALRQLAEGARKIDFADEMAMEYAIAARVARLPDFPEGVRALLIDKDNAPVWRPDTPEAVTEADIDAIFAALPEGEAWTPLG